MEHELFGDRGMRLHGWFRFKSGWGLAWKPVTARRYFSERYGHDPWFTVWPMRVLILRPGRR